MAKVDVGEWQHSIIEDSSLEKYTADGWEFVSLVSVPGIEHVMHEQRFEHLPPAQGTYQPPPMQNYYSGQSGNVINWCKTKVLVRRPREALERERMADAAIENLKTQLATTDAANKDLRLISNEHERKAKQYEDSFNEMAKTVKERAAALEKLGLEKDLLKRHLDTVELDIGKREMDRILGRFPNPPGAIDLGDTNT